MMSLNSLFYLGSLKIVGRGWGGKENIGGGKFKYDIFDILRTFVNGTKSSMY
jgi:hypothetical protein